MQTLPDTEMKQEIVPDKIVGWYDKFGVGCVLLYNEVWLGGSPGYPLIFLLIVE
jgi:hypothetical protein